MLYKGSIPTNNWKISSLSSHWF